MSIQLIGVRPFVTDPHGYQWTIATRKEDFTPQELKQRMDDFMKNFAAPQPAHQ